MKFVIYGRLDGLNEYTKSCRGNAYGANNMKKRNQESVIWAIREHKLPKIDKYPIKLNIVWYEPNKRRDIDNVTFAVKFILDAMVEEKVIIDDSQKYVSEISHIVKVDKEDPRIEVEII